MTISQWVPAPRNESRERLGAFINEVALQASIILMERHLTKKGQFSDADRAVYKQHMVKKFTALLNENNAELATTLFGPQAISSSDRNVSYYETAARKLADIGEKLWKNKKQPLHNKKD